ncbi:E3 ubiquitin-protein ligase rififylin isoform 1-T2 [Menidia menidia]
MFASCCNWFCEDSAGGDPDGRHEAYTNSAFSSQPSPPRTCKACGGATDTPAKKHVCVDCKGTYCGRCSSQRGLHPRLCHTCQRFHGNLLQRAELMKLKVKELRDYLHLHGVPTHLCREKEELVELVLGQQSSSSSSSAPDTPVTAPPSVDPDAPPSPAPSPPPATEAPPPPADATPPPTETPPPPTEAPPPDPDLQDQAEDQEDPEDQEDQEEDPEDQEDQEEVVAPGRRASLSDLSGPDDVEALSVRQLKEILARNFVDYKGCCEKWELMDRVRRLYRDQQTLLAANSSEPADPADRDQNLCRICMDGPLDCVLLECGHLVACSRCGLRLSECPVCRQYVVRAVHVFRA